MKHKIIRGRSLEDKLGKYIPYCNFPAHMGIVRYAQVSTCERRHCKYYEKYRSINDTDKYHGSNF